MGEEMGPDSGVSNFELGVEREGEYLIALFRHRLVV